MPNIPQILHSSQTTLSLQKRCLRDFTTCVKDLSPQRSMEELKQSLPHILVVYKREPSVERVISFLVSALCDKQTPVELMTGVLDVRLTCVCYPITPIHLLLPLTVLA